jgi:hypothetical protein
MGTNAMDNKQVTVEINAGVTADVDAAVAAANNLVLMGYTASENAGAVAGFDIVNGATGNAAGKIVYVALPANGSAWGWFGDRGIPCPLGLSINDQGGTFNVALYYKTLGNE